MRLRVIGSLLGTGALAIAGVVVPMIWPEINAQTGYLILGACSIAFAISIVLYFWPDEVAEGYIKVAGEKDPLFDQSVNVGENNSGNVSAVYNNQINQAPAPQAVWGEQIANDTGEGYYIVTRPLRIVSPYPVNNFHVEVHGTRVRDLQVMPHRAGIQIVGRSGVRDTFAFTNIPQAYGNYTLSVAADSPEVDIRYGFD